MLAITVPQYERYRAGASLGLFEAYLGLFYLPNVDLSEQGVYTDHGNGSCGDGPGSWGHYDRDAQTFADWHISYLKVDFCGFHASPGAATFQDWVDP